MLDVEQPIAGLGERMGTADFYDCYDFLGS
jgi:hypothetical protein